MPKRSLSQRIGDKAEQIVLAEFDTHQSWVCRTQSKDFGVDLEAELANASFVDQDLTGKTIKIQVKGRQKCDVKQGYVIVTVDKDFVNYAAEFRVPFLLVLVDCTTECAWYVWLQEWLIDNEELFYSTDHKSIQLRIPIENSLKVGLGHKIEMIAEGSTTSSIILATRELLEVLIENHEWQLFDQALKLAINVSDPSRTALIGKIANKLIGFGPHCGFWKTAKYQYPLNSLVQLAGDALSLSQIKRLVVRGESYSRAGLSGLDALYDTWPNKAKEMRLGHVFNQLDIFELGWYCRFREKHPEISSIEFATTIIQMGIEENQLGFLALNPTQMVQDRVWQTWPNRGNSAVLDLLTWQDCDELERECVFEIQRNSLGIDTGLQA